MSQELEMYVYKALGFIVAFILSVAFVYWLLKFVLNNLK